MEEKFHFLEIRAKVEADCGWRSRRESNGRAQRANARDHLSRQAD
jgi:hypothetical protein